MQFINKNKVNSVLFIIRDSDTKAILKSKS